MKTEKLTRALYALRILRVPIKGFHSQFYILLFFDNITPHLQSNDYTTLLFFDNLFIF